MNIIYIEINIWPKRKYVINEKCVQIKCNLKLIYVTIVQSAVA